MQDTKGVLKGMGILERIAKVATDVAAVADVAMHGEGKDKMRIKRMRGKGRREIVPFYNK